MIVAFCSVSLWSVWPPLKEFDPEAVLLINTAPDEGGVVQ